MGKKLAYALVTGLGAAAIAVWPLGLPVLWCLGFSSTGVVAGSLAASAQSRRGDVATGTTFAGCQSRAMRK